VNGHDPGSLPEVTPEQYSSSDNAAADCGSNNPIGDTVTPCGRGPVSSRPCDLDEITLSEIAGSRTAGYHVFNGRFVADSPTSKRGIRLFDVETSLPKEAKLQVVGDRPGAQSPTKILASVSAAATCGPTHVAVVVNPPPGQSEIDHVTPALVQDTFTFEASRSESANAAVALFERYIAWGIQPAAYLVSATSCGIRPGGTPKTRGTLTAEVFPADQYQLSLSVPAMGKVSYTRERTTVSSGETTDTSTAEAQLGSDTATVTDTTDTATGITVTDEDIKTVPQKLQFEFKHNGQSGDDITVNINNLLRILSSAQEAVKAIKDVLHEWVPQVGFKFEFDLSFLAGQIVMAWGYKEYTDWRVYYGLSAKFSLTFFEISLTFSFGIQIPAFVARVEGTVNDSAALETDFNFNSPDMLIAPSVKTTVDIPASVSGRAEAGVGWLSVSVELGVRTGFSGEVGLRTKSTTVELYAEIKWEGIDAFVQTKDSPNRGTQEGVWHLVDEKSIWDGVVAF